MMNRGTKRGAVSDSAPDSGDTSLQGKRVMVSTTTDVSKEDSSHQQSMAGPSLDVQRAELAHKHVRALNTQFTSWVQSQLQNHPDEIWEDGLRDYLTHASSIMEKFSDVVAWLREKSTKAKGIPTAVLPTNEKSLLDGTENDKPKVHLQMKSGLAHEASTSGFSSSWSSAISFSNQTPVSFGNQNSIWTKSEAAGDLDEENDLGKPSSPSVKRTEEKGITVVHEVKCKVYTKPDNPEDKGWKDMGMGMLSIKCKEGASKATKESKPTIIIRNDVGKILLNALLYPGIKTNIQKNTIASIFHTLGDSGNGEAAVARTYLLRMKTVEETTKLAAAIKEYAPT